MFQVIFCCIDNIYKILFVVVNLPAPFDQYSLKEAHVTDEYSYCNRVLPYYTLILYLR